MRPNNNSWWRLCSILPQWHYKNVPRKTKDNSIFDQLDADRYVHLLPVYPPPPAAAVPYREPSVPDLGHPVSDLEHHVPDLEHLGPDLQHNGPDLETPDSNIITKALSSVSQKERLPNAKLIFCIFVPRRISLRRARRRRQGRGSRPPPPPGKKMSL